MTSFYSDIELRELGFKSYGKNVLVSRFANFYDIQSITLGNNVRIDDFCILSGKINIGNNVHISAYVALYGQNGIEIKDFSGISPKSTLFSEIDDFSGESPIGPWIEKQKRKVSSGKIILEKYSQIGSNAIIFPNVRISEGAVVGAFSLVKDSIEPWTINGGIPSKFIKYRSKKLLDFL